MFTARYHSKYDSIIYRWKCEYSTLKKQKTKCKSNNELCRRVNSECFVAAQEI